MTLRHCFWIGLSLSALIMISVSSPLAIAVGLSFVVFIQFALIVKLSQMLAKANRELRIHKLGLPEMDEELKRQFENYTQEANRCQI